MQTEFDYRGSPKVKREMWQRSGHTKRFEFGVSERIGTGANRSLLNLVQRATALDLLERRALKWLKQGYSVVWHDRQRWFVATHETLPTVWCVLQEASNV